MPKKKHRDWKIDIISLAARYERLTYGRFMAVHQTDRGGPFWQAVRVLEGREIHVDTEDDI